MTVGLAVVALVFFFAGRFFPGVGENGIAEDGGTDSDKTIWAATQLLEVDRLRDIGGIRFRTSDENQMTHGSKKSAHYRSEWTHWRLDDCSVERQV